MATGKIKALSNVAKGKLYYSNLYTVQGQNTRSLDIPLPSVPEKYVMPIIMLSENVQASVTRVSREIVSVVLYNYTSSDLNLPLFFLYE